MTKDLEICTNRASREKIEEHLHACNASFMPLLSDRLDLSVYAEKIADKANCFEAWVEGELVGLVAAYCNDTEKRTAFITSVSVLPGWKGKGIASKLVSQCIAYVGRSGFRCIELEVGVQNSAAIRLYEKHGFLTNTSCGLSITMHLVIK